MKDRLEFLGKIKTLCAFSLEKDISNNTYMFNETYVDLIDYESFDTKMESLMNEFAELYNVMDKKVALIDSVLNYTRIITKWINENNIENANNLNYLLDIIFQSKNEDIVFNEVVKTKRFTPESLHTEISKDWEGPAPDIIYFLSLNAHAFHNFKDQQSVDFGLLHYIFVRFCRAILNFHSRLEHYKNEITKFGYNPIIDRKSRSLYDRCTLNMSKEEVPYFIDALLDLKIIEFPGTNPEELKAQRNRFIDNNFNYVDARDKNNVVPISRITKEYSKMKTPTIEKDQKQFTLIKNLIISLKKRSEEYRKNLRDEDPL
ncbi:MAG: hypothetical protein ACOYMB_05300 [Patescibacteria group bacterium]